MIFIAEAFLFMIFFGIFAKRIRTCNDIRDEKV